MKPFKSEKPWQFNKPIESSHISAKSFSVEAQTKHNRIVVCHVFPTKTWSFLPRLRQSRFSEELTMNWSETQRGLTSWTVWSSVCVSFLFCFNPLTSNGWNLSVWSSGRCGNEIKWTEWTSCGCFQLRLTTNYYYCNYCFTSTSVTGRDGESSSCRRLELVYSW